ncbi:HDOD domain-containing protein [Desulfatiferula olefinivorans]
MAKTTSLYVPVGELRVAGDEPIELWTVAASCVVLVLIDTVHHVTGMLHVVLPGRRKVLRDDDRNAFFADSGAPLLVNEMKKAGSDPHCLSAVLVGGGSMFQLQEGVDIGRENVAALKAYLTAQGIPVIREETGGTDGRRVSVQCVSHLLSIETIRDTPSDETSPSRPPAADRLKPYSDRLEIVPADKTLTGALLAEIHAATINWDRVCLILSKDPVPALRFFRLVNSSYYGVSEPIASFTQARQRLSVAHFRRICIVTSVSGNKTKAPSLSDEIIREWKNHSLAAAFIARHLSETIMPDRKEEAYVAGLFHSVGNLCLSLEQPARITQGMDDRHESGASLSAELMRFWHFPEILSGSVGAGLTRGEGRHTEAERLSAILHVACWISRLIGVSSQVEPNHFILDRQMVKTLGISDSVHTLLPPILTGLARLGVKQWTGHDSAA